MVLELPDPPTLQNAFLTHVPAGLWAGDREGLAQALGIPVAEVEMALARKEVKELVGCKKNLYYLKASTPGLKALESIAKNYWALESIFFGEPVNPALSGLDTLKQAGVVALKDKQYQVVGPAQNAMESVLGGTSRDERLTGGADASPEQKERMLGEFYKQKLHEQPFYIINFKEVSQHVPVEFSEMVDLGKRLANTQTISYRVGIITAGPAMRRKEPGLPQLDMPEPWNRSAQEYVLLSNAASLIDKRQDPILDYTEMAFLLKNRTKVSKTLSEEMVKALEQSGYLELGPEGVRLTDRARGFFPAPVEPQEEPKAQSKGRPTNPYPVDIAKRDAPPGFTYSKEFNDHQVLVVNAIHELGGQVKIKQVAKLVQLDPNHVSKILNRLVKNDVIFSRHEKDYLQIELNPSYAGKIPMVALPGTEPHPAPAYDPAPNPLLKEPGSGSALPSQTPAPRQDNRQVRPLGEDQGNYLRRLYKRMRGEETFVGDVADLSQVLDLVFRKVPCELHSLERVGCLEVRKDGISYEVRLTERGKRLAEDKLSKDSPAYTAN